MQIATYFRRFTAGIAAHWVISIIVAAALGGAGWWYYAAHSKNPYQFISVTSGPITETVSVTGNTTPLQSVSLGFRNSGIIARVYARVGDWVSAGDVIAQLDTATLSAALQQAQAAYNSAIASRSSTSLPATVTEARNTYLSAYTTIDTALFSYADTFFGGSTPYGPQLLINAPMYEYGELSKDREALKQIMNEYQRALPDASITNPSILLDNAYSVTQKVSTFLNKLADAANGTGSTATSAQLTALSTARSSIDALLTKISTAQDAYRTDSVGATSLADASVEQAAAGIAVAKANLQGMTLAAPISGVVTQQDAKVGQVASAGTPLITIISENAFEIDARIPETNIGKVMVGNPVSLTLDAFPGETFEGKVFYIDPAETITQGVIDYKIKVSFTKPDPRIKSGLTANLDILTRHKDAVLKLPQYAILQTDAGTFVQVLQNGKKVDIPVTLGIQDKAGNVEILRGVTEGEQVLNIGLKQ